MRRSAAPAMVAVLAVAVALGVVGARDNDLSVVPPSESRRTATDGQGRSSPSPTASDADATLIMWARGGLPPAIVDQAAALSGVMAAAFVRSDTLGLVGSHRPDGSTIDRLPDGFRIPVSVAAVDPGAYAATLPTHHTGDTVAALRPGQVLLSETSASLRRIAAGGAIDLQRIAGLQVAGVVPDGTVRNAEIVLHAADADAAGLEPDGSLVVRHEDAGGPAREALTAALRALAPQNIRVRVVEGRAASNRHRAPLVLSLLEVKARFGEFAYRPRAGLREVDVDSGFVARNIVSAQVPLLGTVRCHQAIVEDLRAALQEVVDAGLAHTIDPAKYAGCYYPRRIAQSGERLSRHSWGIAVDINVDLSQPSLGPPPPPEVVEAFARHGFRWGGHFLQPDNHHFEWVGQQAAERPPAP